MPETANRRSSWLRGGSSRGPLTGWHKGRWLPCTTAQATSKRVRHITQLPTRYSLCRHRRMRRSHMLHHDRSSSPSRQGTHHHNDEATHHI